MWLCIRHTSTGSNIHVHTSIQLIAETYGVRQSYKCGHIVLMSLFLFCKNNVLLFSLDGNPQHTELIELLHTFDKMEIIHMGDETTFLSAAHSMLAHELEKDLLILHLHCVSLAWTQLPSRKSAILCQ